MNKSKKIISLAILLVIALFQLSSVPAIHNVMAGPLDLNNQEGLNNASGDIGGVAFGAGGNTDIRIIVVSYIKIFLGLLGMIFVILIMMAGYKYMMASEEKETKEALDKIKHAVIGLVIILASYGITVFVAKQINGATSGNFSM